MTLASVFNTARSAISAAEMALGVTSNNLANVQTDGFKASQTVFATATPSTRSWGTSPSGRSGGTNPIQSGTGVQVAAVGPEFGPGPVVGSSNPLDLALEGNALFVLEGPRGERQFSREGRFGINANGEMVSATGYRLLGYAAKANSRPDVTRLAPLKISPESVGQHGGLMDIRVGSDGRVQGRFVDGTTHYLGHVALARLANPSGLEHQAPNSWEAGSNSGAPDIVAPGDATIISNARELSNASIEDGLIDLSLLSTLFRVNLPVLKAAGSLLDDLLNLQPQ